MANTKKNETFSVAAIASVSGKSASTIYSRMKAKGFRPQSGKCSLEQAYDLVYYVRKKPGKRKENLAQEATRLIKSLEKYNARIGHKTVIAA